jgi:hypothetical protein
MVARQLAPPPIPKETLQQAESSELFTAKERTSLKRVQAQLAAGENPFESVMTDSAEAPPVLLRYEHDLESTLLRVLQQMLAKAKREAQVPWTPLERVGRTASLAEADWEEDRVSKFKVPAQYKRAKDKRTTRALAQEDAAAAALDAQRVAALETKARDGKVRTTRAKRTLYKAVQRRAEVKVEEVLQRAEAARGRYVPDADPDEEGEWVDGEGSSEDEQVLREEQQEAAWHAANTLLAAAEKFDQALLRKSYTGSERNEKVDTSSAPVRDPHLAEGEFEEE